MVNKDQGHEENTRSLLLLTPARTLLQILQTLPLPADHGAHAAQGGALQLLAAVQGVPVLHEPHVIFGNT